MIFLVLLVKSFDRFCIMTPTQLSSLVCTMKTYLFFLLAIKMSLIFLSSLHSYFFLSRSISPSIVGLLLCDYCYRHTNYSSFSFFFFFFFLFFLSFAFIRPQIIIYTRLILTRLSMIDGLTIGHHSPVYTRTCRRFSRESIKTHLFHTSYHHNIIGLINLPLTFNISSQYK